MFVVLGLVAWIKSWGVAGNWLNLASMLVGLVLGAGYQISSVGLPGDFAGWFAVIVFGLGLGVVASGVYKVGGQLAEKASVSILNDIDDEL